MDEYEKQILDLAEQLTELEVGKPRSIIGVIDLVHRLVEETARRNKKKEKLSEVFKKELTIRTLKGVVQILKEKDLINVTLFEIFITNIDEENLDLFLECIEDIVEIYNSELVQGCLCCKKKKNDNLKNLKKLKVKKIN